MKVLVHGRKCSESIAWPTLCRIAGRMLIATVGLTTLPAWGQASQIRVAVLPSYVMPLGKYANQELMGGLVFDMTQAIGKEMHLPVHYRYLSRRRLEPALLNGEADLVCYINKAWVENNVEDFFWTPSLFKNQTIVLGAAATPVANNMHDLYGQTVGGILGYLYPGLDEQFAKGNIKREDAPSDESAYKKLLLGRVPYLAVDKLEHEYFIQHNGIPQAFNRGTVLLDEFDVECAVSKKSLLKPQAVNAAVTHIVKLGVPEQWLAQYR